MKCRKWGPYNRLLMVSYRRSCYSNIGSSRWWLDRITWPQTGRSPEQHILQNLQGYRKVKNVELVISFLPFSQSHITQYSIVVPSKYEIHTTAKESHDNHNIWAKMGAEMGTDIIKRPSIGKDSGSLTLPKITRKNTLKTPLFLWCCILI